MDFVRSFCVRWIGSLVLAGLAFLFRKKLTRLAGWGVRKFTSAVQEEVERHQPRMSEEELEKLRQENRVALAKEIAKEIANAKTEDASPEKPHEP